MSVELLALKAKYVEVIGPLRGRSANQISWLRSKLESYGVSVTDEDIENWDKTRNTRQKTEHVPEHVSRGAEPCDAQVASSQGSRLSPCTPEKVERPAGETATHVAFCSETQEKVVPATDQNVAIDAANSEAQKRKSLISGDTDAKHAKLSHSTISDPISDVPASCDTEVGIAGAQPSSVPVGSSNNISGLPIVGDSEAAKQEAAAAPNHSPGVAPLSPRVLAVLPPDAPPGHQAWLRVHSWSSRSYFVTQADDGEKVRLQVTFGRCCDSSEIAERIARACFVLIFDDGKTREEAIQFRDECYDRLAGLRATRKEPEPPSLSSQARAPPKEPQLAPNLPSQAKSPAPQTGAARPFEPANIPTVPTASTAPDTTVAAPQKPPTDMSTIPQSSAPQTSTAGPPVQAKSPAVPPASAAPDATVPEPKAAPNHSPCSAPPSPRTLVVLPPDAPPGHDAWRSVKRRADRSYFEHRAEDQEIIRLQVTLRQCYNSFDIADRIVRACYVMIFDEGRTREEAIQFRNECFDKLAELRATAKVPRSAPSVPPQTCAPPKEQQPAPSLLSQAQRPAPETTAPPAAAQEEKSTVPKASPTPDSALAAAPPVQAEILTQPERSPAQASTLAAPRPSPEQPPPPPAMKVEAPTGIRLQHVVDPRGENWMVRCPKTAPRRTLWFSCKRLGCAGAREAALEHLCPEALQRWIDQLGDQDNAVDSPSAVPKQQVPTPDSLAPAHEKARTAPTAPPPAPPARKLKSLQDKYAQLFGQPESAEQREKWNDARWLWEQLRVPSACQYCNEVFESNAELKRHKRECPKKAEVTKAKAEENGGDWRHKSDGQKLSNEKKMQGHRKGYGHVDEGEQRSPSSKVWSCSHCKNCFRRRQDFLSHIEACAPAQDAGLAEEGQDKQTSLECVRCKTWHASRSLLYQHWKECKATYWVCRGCKEAFQARKHLEQHRRTCLSWRAVRKEPPGAPRSTISKSGNRPVARATAPKENKGVGAATAPSAVDGQSLISLIRQRAGAQGPFPEDSDEQGPESFSESDTGASSDGDSKTGASDSDGDDDSSSHVQESTSASSDNAKAFNLLPHGWEKEWSDEYGIPFYYNVLTGESRWERPL